MACQSYYDFYLIQGVDFIGGDDTYLWYEIDRLVSIYLHPPFYGTTAQGNGIGSTREAWEQELGPPVRIHEHFITGLKTYIYLASDKEFGIRYTGGGELMTDQAYTLVLNANFLELPGWVP